MPAGMTSIPQHCLGVAAVLKEWAPQLAGTVRLIFQPAEEVLEGAAAMIADGAAKGIDFAIGFHNHPEMPVGSFGFVRRAALAASDRFDLVIQGRSRHAAHPDTAVDPIVAAALSSARRNPSSAARSGPCIRPWSRSAWSRAARPTTSAPSASR